MQFCYRFHSSSAAKRVRHFASLFTDAKLVVERQPNTETRHDRAGDYCIVSERTDLNFCQDERLHDCVNFAIQIALADELRKHAPGDALLTIWHLRPENIDKVGKYKIHDGSTQYLK